MADADGGFIRMRGLLARIPVSKSTIWTWVQEGKFPAPFKLSDRITVWRAADVARWETEKTQACNAA